MDKAEYSPCAVGPPSKRNSGAECPVTTREVEVLRARLVVKLARKGIRDEDLEDAVGRALQRILSGIAQKLPDDLDSYASRVAESVFADYVRLRRPNWSRLRRRIYYLLSYGRSPEPFGLWQVGNKWLGGLSEWTGQPIRATKHLQALRATQDVLKREVLGGKCPAEVSLPELLWSLFKFIATPLDLDSVTSEVALLLQQEEPKVISLDSPSIRGEPSEDQLPQMELPWLQENLWKEVLELPSRQRSALLLGMSREDLALLVPSISEFAQTVSSDSRVHLAIWNSLPLSDKEIGTRIEATSQQVSNLRKCARKRLGRRLALWKREEW